MKTKFIWRFWSIVTLVVAIFYIASCDEKDNPVPQTPPEENTGDITIDIPNLGGEGSGTSSDPAVVPQGETFNLEINQKSSYKDTDGSVYTCEPKAIINLSTESDTIYVKDLASLTEIIGNPVVKTSKSGNNPVQHQTTQTFNIGGQNVNFELSYEVYNYVNKASQTIEMPYVKVNNANLGKASSETSRSQAPAISLKR